LTIFRDSYVLTHDRESFRSSYAGSPPWDIGKPQPAFQAAAILNAAFPDRDNGRVARNSATAGEVSGNGFAGS